MVNSFKKAPSSDGVTCVRSRYPILQFRGAFLNLSEHLHAWSSCMSSNVGICNVSSLSIRPDDNLLPMKRNLKFLIDLSTSFPKTCFLWSLSSGERLGLMDWPDRLFLLSGGGGLPSTSDKFRAVDFHCTHGSRLRLLQKWNFCEGWSGETYWKTWMVEVDSYKNKKWDWSTRTFLPLLQNIASPPTQTPKMAMSIPPSSSTISVEVWWYYSDIYLMSW